MCFKKEGLGGGRRGGGGWKPLTNYGYEEGKCNPSYSLTCKVVSQILLFSSESGKFGSALLDSFLNFYYSAHDSDHEGLAFWKERP